jgi:hypothetical protein
MTNDLLSEKKASPELIAERVAILQDVFYETPEKVFELLTRAIIFLEPTEKRLSGIFNDAVYSIRKTRITIADILSDEWEERKHRI